MEHSLLSIPSLKASHFYPRLLLYCSTLSWQTEEKNRVEQALSVYVFLEFLATMRCSPYPLAPYFSKLYQSKSPGMKVCGKLYVVFLNTLQIVKLNTWGPKCPSIEIWYIFFFILSTFMCTTR